MLPFISLMIVFTSFLRAKKLLKQWESLRRAYLYTMTANQRRLIKHHSEILFTEEVRRQFGFDIKKIFSATTLEDLDLHYTW